MPEGASGVASSRSAAITGFAEALRALRQSAGNPSFREMSGRSRAISHTTLHEAAQGNRLPSWATTVEFVKACDGEPGEYRERWEAANRALRHGAEPAKPAPAPAVADEPASPDVPDLSATDPALRPPRRWYALAGAAAVVAVTAVVIGFVAFTGSDGAAHTAKSGSPVLAGAETPGHCSVVLSTPKYAPPAHPGDHGRFGGDITYPDCTHVARGSEFVKVWRLLNTGTVTWVGYSLRRLDLPAGRNACQTITDVPIRRTAPGQAVDIRTEVTAPGVAGPCFVRFRVVDAAGVDAFPAGRPVYFKVIVD